MNELLKRANKILIVILTITYTGLLLYQIATTSLKKAAFYQTANDFLAIHTALLVVKEGNIQNLYNIQTQKDAQGLLLLHTSTMAIMTYRLPPLYVAALNQLALTPKNICLLLVTLNTVMVFLLAMVFSNTLVQKDRVVWTFVFFNLGVLHLPIVNTILNAQLSLLLAGVVLLTYWALRNGRPITAGFILGLLLLKPSYLLMIPPLLLLAPIAKKKLLAGFSISIFILGSLNYLVYQKSSLLFDYLYFLLRTEGPTAGTLLQRNFNLPSILAQTSDLTTHTFGIGLLIYGFILTVCLVVKRKVSLERAVSLAVLISLLLNFHTQITDLTLFLVVILLLFKELRSRISRWGMIFLFYFSPWVAPLTDAALVTVSYLLFTLFLWLDIKTDASDTQMKVNIEKEV